MNPGNGDSRLKQNCVSTCTLFVLVLFALLGKWHIHLIMIRLDNSQRNVRVPASILPGRKSQGPHKPK